MEPNSTVNKFVSTSTCIDGNKDSKTVLTPLKCLFRDMANAELISYKDKQVRQLKLLQDIASVILKLNYSRCH